MEAAVMSALDVASIHCAEVKRVKGHSMNTYILDVHLKNNEIYKLKKTYTDIVNYHNQLIEHFQNRKTVNVPSISDVKKAERSTWLFKSKSAANEKRMKAVESYLEITRELSDSPAFHDFFSKDNQLTGGDDDDGSHIQNGGKKRKSKGTPSSISRASVTSTDSGNGSDSPDIRRVVKDYQQRKKTEISVREGDLVEMVEHHEAGWCMVRNHKNTEEEGLIPASVLESKGQDEEKLRRIKLGKYMTRRDITARRPDELSLKKGAVVEVVQVACDGWWKARYEGKEGLVARCDLETMTGRRRLPSMYERTPPPRRQRSAASITVQQQQQSTVKPYSVVEINGAGGGGMGEVIVEGEEEGDGVHIDPYSTTESVNMLMKKTQQTVVMLPPPAQTQHSAPEPEENYSECAAPAVPKKSEAFQEAYGEFTVTRNPPDDQDLYADPDTESPTLRDNPAYRQPSLLETPVVRDDGRRGGGGGGDDDEDDDDDPVNPLYVNVSLRSSQKSRSGYNVSGDVSVTVATTGGTKPSSAKSTATKTATKVTTASTTAAAKGKTGKGSEGGTGECGTASRPAVSKKPALAAKPSKESNNNKLAQVRQGSLLGDLHTKPTSKEETYNYTTSKKLDDQHNYYNMDDLGREVTKVPNWYAGSCERSKIEAYMKEHAKFGQFCIYMPQRIGPTKEKNNKDKEKNCAYVLSVMGKKGAEEHVFHYKILKLKDGFAIEAKKNKIYRDITRLFRALQKEAWLPLGGDQSSNLADPLTVDSLQS